MLEVEDLENIEDLALSVLNKYRFEIESTRELTEEESSVFAQAGRILSNRRQEVEFSLTRADFKGIWGKPMRSRRVLGQF